MPEMRRPQRISFYRPFFDWPEMPRITKLLVDIWWDLTEKKERPFGTSVAYTGKHKGRKGSFTLMPPVRLEMTMPVFDLPL